MTDPGLQGFNKRFFTKQSGVLCKSVDWFLHDRNLHYKSDNGIFNLYKNFKKTCYVRQSYSTLRFWADFACCYWRQHNITPEFRLYNLHDVCIDRSNSCQTRWRLEVEQLGLIEIRDSRTVSLGNVSALKGLREKFLAKNIFSMEYFFTL